MAAIPEPRLRNPLLRLGVAISEKATGQRLVPARLLTWYPKAAIGAGVMEALVAHADGQLTPRLLHLVRLTASIAANCAFCIDMNGDGRDATLISDDEVLALRDWALDADGAGAQGEWAASFTEQERLVIEYTLALTRTPIEATPELLERVTAAFTPREVVVLASTVGQVNFWTRSIQGLGITPAGFSDTCEVVARESASD